MKTVKAKKEYKCDLTNKTSSVEESYKRVKHLKSSSNYTDEEIKNWRYENNIPEGVPLLPPDYVKVSSIFSDYEDNHLFEEDNIDEIY